MTLSIHTNANLLTALQNMNSTQVKQTTAQNRVSTGLKVQGAIDDASNFAIAQGIRTDVSALSAVQQQKNNVLGLLKVTNAALESAQNIVHDIKEKVTALANPAINAEQRNILRNDVDMLIAQYDNFIQNATFNSENLINGEPLNNQVFLNPNPIDIGNAPPIAGQSVNVDFDIRVGSGNDSDQMSPNITFRIEPSGRTIPYSLPEPSGVWPAGSVFNIAETISLTAADLASGSSIRIFADIDATYPTVTGENISDSLFIGGFDTRIRTNFSQDSGFTHASTGAGALNGVYQPGDAISFRTTYDVPSNIINNLGIGETATLSFEQRYQHSGTDALINSYLVNLTGPIANGTQIIFPADTNFIFPQENETIGQKQIINTVDVSSGDNAIVNVLPTITSSMLNWNFSEQERDGDEFWFNISTFEYINNIEGDEETISRRNVTSGALGFGNLDFSTAESSLLAFEDLQLIEADLGDEVAYFARETIRLSASVKFDNAISDAVETGLGNIVDADMARESARLTASQVNRELSAQILGIVGKSSQILLMLFK